MTNVSSRSFYTSGMSTNSPVAPGESSRVFLTPSRSTLPSDDCGDTTQLAATWRGSNVSIASPVDSPLVRRAAVNLLLGVPSTSDSVSSWSLDDQTTTDDSSHTTPLRSHSPGPSLASHHGSKRYRNELWSAIKSDYLYLMDEEIIDACKVCTICFQLTFYLQKIPSVLFSSL